ncbi:hypothetical protein RFI_06764 [Reticulomyxa filosa]|uniref:Viral A-type inclusion protein n=1 Tax=Reticulomyxa filosa TaxID=46433 RepID=X6NWV7_RETFI|nr:hypothetical protein RFI_06764 [Reticulomyxa filosa]|eukprot:ETO30358.1 hypothetical protein RFI_06764 [Reticulomyxa filosa]
MEIGKGEGEKEFSSQTKISNKKIEEYKKSLDDEKRNSSDLKNQLQKTQNNLKKVAGNWQRRYTQTEKTNTTEKQRRESLSSMSNHMITSLTEAEDEHGKAIKDMQARIDLLEEEKKSLNLQLHAEERKRKSSNAEVSASMFNKLLLIEQEKEYDKTNYEQKIKELEQQLEELTIGAPRRASEVHSSMFKSLLEAEADYNNAKLEWNTKEQQLKNEIQSLNEQLGKSKQKAELSDKQRRESISQLQDDMWKHLVESDEDNKKEKKKMLVEIKTVKDENSQLKRKISYLENSKLAMIEECNRQMNLLRIGVRVMNGQ